MTRPRRLGLALLATIVALSPVAVTAQDDDPDAIFFGALEMGADADEARDEVEAVYGPEMAAELAAYWCSPDPGDGCEDTFVLAAWEDWQEAIEDGGSVDEVGIAIAQGSDDWALAAAMAIYWCSPEADDGCDDTEVMAAWDGYEALFAQDVDPADAIALLREDLGDDLANQLGAFVCGHPTCFAGMDAPVMTPDPPPSAGPSGRKYKNAQRRRTGRRG